MRFSRGRRLQAELATASLSLLLVGWATVAAPAAHAASNLGVYVGYADSVHASASHFPTPWFGDSGVNFQGCNPTSSCAYDAGAVRLVNNSNTSLSIDKITVNIGTCPFSLWSAQTVPAGGQLIVTQTISGAASGCVNDGTLDTSDVPSAGNCTPDGIIPSVDVTISGTKTSFSDTAQVLNTGGVDPGSCAGTNESNQWTLIGTAACPGSSLTLAPSSQSDQTGSPATVTANFSNSCNIPLSGVTVNFSVISGPNIGLTGSGVTDTSGNASFTYTGSTVGTYSVQASVTNGSGTVTSNTVSVTWANGVAVCQPNQSCTATASVPNSMSSSITGTSSTGGTIIINIGQDTISCGDTFAHAPAVTTFATQGSFTAPKHVVLTIAKAAVAGRNKNKFEICYSSPTPFVDQFGHTGTTGILPSCRKVGNVAPCEISTTSKKGDVIETFIVSASDPKFF